MRLIWCHERRRRIGDSADGAAGWRAGVGTDDDGKGEESFRVPDCRDEESLWGAVWGEEEVGLERDSSPPQECVGNSE
jgi:hypothetical protein